MFGLHRVSGAAELAHRQSTGILTAPAQLTTRLRIDGLMSDQEPTGTDGVVTGVIGQNLISVHGYRPPLGMWIAGEVLVAQRFLLDRGCASVRSIMVVGRGDEPVAQVLSARADVNVVVQRPDRPIPGDVLP